jgi:ferredoxin/truncated hemoglobin YjbI
MVKLEYQENLYSCRENETVLQAFMRQGVTVPFSCGNGVCHVCLQRCESGDIPADAQKGLQETLKQKGYFMVCKCTPKSDMKIAPPRDADLLTPAEASAKVEDNAKTEAAEHIQHLEQRKYPEPDLELWEVLGEGHLLSKVLRDFYNHVYDDARLSPFFKDVTKQRLIEKQYNFMYQILTGKDVYFGERPRNAHHWMVISDELLDYREELMELCLRRFGVPEKFIERLRAIEEIYRKDIVKNKPWNKILFGKEMPVEGFDEITLDSATLCDSCQQEISIGTLVQYHVRLGKVYCEPCRQDSNG